MGDFNDLDTKSLVSDRNFVQVVDKATRGDRILDKIITNFSAHYKHPSIMSPLGASDHCTVIWSPINAATSKPNLTCKRITRPMKDSAIREFAWSEASHI